MLFDLLSNCKLGRDLRCYIGPKPSLNICSDTGFQGRRFERVLLPSERQQVKTELAIAKRRKTEIRSWYSERDRCAGIFWKTVIDRPKGDPLRNLDKPEKLYII